MSAPILDLPEAEECPCATCSMHDEFSTLGELENQEQEAA